MSDKALGLTGVELELTQRIQMYFPRGVISTEILSKWNGCPKEIITTTLIKVFSELPKRFLLEFIGTVTVAATTTLFIAKDHFVVNTKKNAPVKISYLGDNFKAQFLGKEEQPFAGSTLNYGKLSRSSVDGPIIAALGGEEKAETTLTELFSLMEAQKNGEDGLLLTNGYANIFYIKDVTGVLCAVSAGWGGDGWSVSAIVVTDPCEWLGGLQVFSCNSR